MDPISLVVRYLSTVGIRIIDLFRMFDADMDGLVSRQEFIRGLKVGINIYIYIYHTSSKHTSDTLSGLDYIIILSVNSN